MGPIFIGIVLWNVLDSFNCLASFFLNMKFKLQSLSCWKYPWQLASRPQCLQKIREERIYHFERTFISLYLFNLLKLLNSSEYFTVQNMIPQVRLHLIKLKVLLWFRLFKRPHLRQVFTILTVSLDSIWIDTYE